MNPGKRFENDFKASVPEGVYYLRLHDSAIGFDIEHSTQRFAIKSPYDVVLCRDGQMYALELKSNQETSMSFVGSSPRIQMRQVDELIKAERSGVVAGLVLNFRTFEETYFVPASVFKVFADMSGKKSVNIHDARGLGRLIPARKLKVNYRYDLSPIWAERRTDESG